MNAKPSPPTSGPTAETLGDVLYVDGAADCVSEADWAQLVQRMVAQDQLALRELYERSHRLVFTLMMRMTHTRETAEDLTLEVFHDLWQKAAEYRADAGTVLAWVMNRARSKAIDRLRFEQRLKRVNPYPGDPALQNAETDSSELSEVEDNRVLLKGALAMLTAAERAAIEAAFFGELTHEEVAARLHEPLGTVKTRIRSGLAKLRQAFAARAGRP